MAIYAARGFQLLSALAVLLLACSAPLVRADCPDAGIRCRIPQSDWGSTVTTNGCSVNGDASATITGEVPSGTVSISGQCYTTVQTSDNAVYAVVGSITIGQCYDLFQGGCQPDHCPGNSPGQRCVQQLSGCTTYPTICTSTYTVQEGDDCSDIADGKQMTLADLEALTPPLTAMICSRAKTCACLKGRTRTTALPNARVSSTVADLDRAVPL